MRISKVDHYLEIAKSVAKRSTCLRRQYGAVIVKDDQIIATGYNGSARGEENCCDTGICIRNQKGVKSGERYELCVAIHAEANAIISAGRLACIGADLYLYGEENKKVIKEPKPCLMCARLIKNCGLRLVEPTH